MEQSGAPPNNPDSGADYEEICAVMEEKLVPVFDMIGKEIHDLHEDLGELQNLVFKFMTSMIGAADEHKRGGLSEMIKSKYGPDLDPIDGFYKDTKGTAFSDELIDSLMQDGAPDESGIDEFVKGKLGEVKGKYGKYLGGVTPEIEIEAGAEGEAPEVEAEEKSVEAPEQSEEPVDPASALMKKLGGLNCRGK